VKIETAWPLNGDEVSAAVIVKRHMQRLMNIADPMTDAFEEPIKRIGRDRADVLSSSAILETY